MKTKVFFLTVLMVFVSICTFSQNLVNVAPKTLCDSILFPEDSTGNIVYENIVDCKILKDTIRANINSWLQKIQIKEDLNASVRNVYNADGKAQMKIGIPVGIQFVVLPGTVLQQARSKIEFLVNIEYKNKKYRYKYSNFRTSRRIIRGEAKSEGQSNWLHCQRINSLYNERKEYVGKRSKKAQDQVSEYDKIIKSEKQQYELEYKTVQTFIVDMNKEISKEPF